MMHEAASPRQLPDLAEVDAILAEVGAERRHLVAVLQTLQVRFNYLPQEALEHIVERTGIGAAELMSVASFYAQFRLRPAGRHQVKVCVGTACHVQGAADIVRALREHLQIADGDDTDAAQLYTVQEVACLGCCMLAPAVQIDDITYGFVKANEVGQMLEDFQATRRRTKGVPDAAAVAGNGHAAELRICLCSSCAASGARDVAAELSRLISELGLAARLKLVGCTGMAYRAPLLEIVLSDGASFRYGELRPAELRSVLLEHLRPSRRRTRGWLRVESWLEHLLGDGAQGAPERRRIDLDSGPDHAFSAPQKHLATAHCGCRDPLDLDEYLEHGGFAVARRVAVELGPEEVMARIDRSGLRGRGGAGFPTAAKWRVVAAHDSCSKVVICNGDEGDPGAFMDRQILESFPFRVIEGMVIACLTLGAERGYLYIRAEYPQAITRIRTAIAKARDRGLLGPGHLGAGRALELEVVPGAGAFVCGEETALIAAMEGRRGTPRLKPPYPADEGLWGLPTLVNNVETFALLPGIVGDPQNGFSHLGTTTSRGTKSFALAGKVRRSGLIEVPMGMSLRRIVMEIGGGLRDGRRLKAVQVGGPSGGCVPEWLADTPVDYESLQQAGAMMGSGGMVVLDDSDCMVEVARYFMAFTQAESCGKCSFCRVGTTRMLEILERLCAGRAAAGELVQLEELADGVRRGSLCGLGRSAPNPVLSTLEHFRNEYEAHLEGRCPAGRCRELISFSVNRQCIGCTRCAQGCPVAAVRGVPKQRHVIDPERCTRCGSCRQTCPAGAVEVS